MWNHCLRISYFALLICPLLIGRSYAAGTSASAAPTQSGGAPTSAPSSSANSIQPPSQTSTKEGDRNFYDVLEDILSDFEYDLKNGNVAGLKDIAIRNIATSENIPPSFKNHLDLLITERILKTSKARVLQCLPCKARKTTLNGDQMTVSSPDTNPAELARIAKTAGISHFLDSAFSYQPTGIVLSMYISDPDTGSVVWSRSYNSESSRAAAFRRGVDYNQIDDARRQTEYTPTVLHRFSLYYLFEPNLPQNTGTLALGYRMMERYDNRKKEVGFEVEYHVDPTTMVSSVGVSAQNIYAAWGLNLTLTFVHAWNFIGEEENYNSIRGSAFAALGGTYASGFLGGLLRFGYEWRLGKHFGISAILGYRPAASAFVSGSTSGTISGIEYGIGVNALF
ncbi:MAG: hypothetical protein HYX41_05495 [Bdellovibrio sp.]|nr:hypothetical protein [Bdellovibrio sp.]